MSRPVPVIGGAHVVREPGQRLEELVYRTARAALADADVAHAEVGDVMLAASDELDGRGITSMLNSMPAAGYLKDVNKVTDSGLHALALGAMKIRCGQSSTVLVMSWDGSSEAPILPVARTALEPFVERPIGVSDPMASAVMVERYLHEHDLGPELLDELAALRCREAGVDYDPRPLATPLRDGHLAPIVDSASAVVLTADPGSRPVRAEYLASGWRTDTYYVDQRERPSRLVARSVADALRKARLSINDVDHFEVDDSAPHLEAWAAEGLGLAAVGKGLATLLAAPGTFSRRAPGTRSGYGPLSAGLMRIASSSASAGSLSLVHQSIGRAAQGQIVSLVRRLGGEDA